MYSHPPGQTGAKPPNWRFFEVFELVRAGSSYLGVCGGPHAGVSTFYTEKNISVSRGPLLGAEIHDFSCVREVKNEEISPECSGENHKWLLPTPYATPMNALIIYIISIDQLYNKLMKKKSSGHFGSVPELVSVQIPRGKTPKFLQNALEKTINDDS